jgi:hypothetical protein
VPTQGESAGSYDIVLSAPYRRDVVGRRTREEIASFATERDEPPDATVNSGAEIEDPARKLLRNRVGPACR